LQTPKSGFRLRETLVVLQFAITVIFILTTFIVSMQTGYVQTKNVGFDRNNLVYIPLEDNLISKYQLFKSQLMQISGIKEVDRISQLPHDMGFKTIDIDWEGKTQDQILRITPVSVGYDFSSLMNLSLVDGRSFSRDVASDQNNFIINETAMRDMKLQAPLGKQIKLFGKEGEIIGVIQDFHFNSLHDPILPLIIDLKEELEFGTALVRIEDGKAASVLPRIQTIIKDLNPTKTFSYSFADDEYLKLYKTEQLIENLSLKFAILSVVLSCLGLFGLASFTVQQRTKEIGIRKVMGASASSIVVLLSKYFMFLITIALAIALPAAWYITEKWLNGFSYRIDSTVSVYLLTVVIVSGMAIITFCYHSIKASTTDPIKVIRTE
ncbi:MAG: ABC transporter permease, partial [Flammeovirgaceae bacterium]